MSKKLYPETDIQNIANAIRNLNGSSDTYTVSEMASAIALPENGYYLKESASANPLSITDGEELNAQSCEVSFSPIQDLHGYESPWIDSDVINKEPYLMRAVSGTATRIGNSLFDTLVGGTVVWNQKIDKNRFEATKTEKGVTFTNNNDGTVTVNGTATNDTYYELTSIAQTDIPTGNKVLTTFNENLVGSNSSFELGLSRFNGTGTVHIYNNKVVEKGSGSSTSFSVRIIIRSGYTANNLIFTPQLTDLTAMFGSTIADYIYSLEQATAGSGVAYFRSLFPKDYYAYNTGQLMSVKALSHKMVGFNQWDEEWEVGRYDDSGNPVDSNLNIRTKNPIRVLPNTQYCFYSQTGRISHIYWYDSEDTFIKSDSNQSQAGVLTSPSNALYVRFRFPDSYGNVYQGGACLNISSSENGKYEAYEEHIYPLDSDLELRGIPKLDSNNKLYYDGDTYESDGTVTRRYGIVDLGTLDWTYNSTRKVFISNVVSVIKIPSLTTVIPNVICKNYIAKEATSVFNNAENNNKCIAIIATGALAISDQSYNDAQTFKTAMSGEYLVYELATPTTETADTFQNPQVCDEYGTEEYTDSRTVQIPVGHETYQANICEISGWDVLHLYQDTEQTETPETTYTATFGQTYYGGKYDFVSGKLIITYAIKKIGDITWARSTSYANPFFYSQNQSDIKANTSIITEDYGFYGIDTAPNFGNNATNGQCGITANGLQIFVRDDSFTDANTFKTTMSDVKIVYELETPIEITLTPSQIALLEDNNVLWSDSNGNVKLKYFSKSLT